MPFLLLVDYVGSSSVCWSEPYSIFYRKSWNFESQTNGCGRHDLSDAI